MEKYSKQREEILGVLKKSYSHPTAEEVYNIVKKQNSTSSKGTVYRNLKFLVEKGDIIKISIPDSGDRYDYIRKPHSHAICTICNKVFDFEYNFKLNLLEKEVEKQTDLQINYDSITVNGVCKKCREKNKNEEVFLWN